MSDYVLTCSSTSDLSSEYTKAHDIGVVPYHFYMDGQEYLDDQGQSMSHEEFYRRMRDGSNPSTSMVNMEMYMDFFRPYLKAGKDILHLELGSGLSGTFQSARMAAETILEDFPDRSIRIIDSTMASLGFGLLVVLTEDKKEAGATFQEAGDFAEQTAEKIVLWFAVESLEYLRRGGRVSRASAFVGNLLNIKPVLSFNDEGKVIPVEKIRGRKKSLKAILDKMELDIDHPDGQTILVGHADAPEDAEWLVEQVKERFPGVDKVIVKEIGPVIGTHAGPGTVGLAYLGKERIHTKFE